jgi:hypothetical protein
MADVWTVSEWSIGEADPAVFVAAFRRFAEAATALGGAREEATCKTRTTPRTLSSCVIGIAKRSSTPGLKNSIGTTMS